MRTLAFTHKPFEDGDEHETGLTWDGFVGIRDPLRDDIRESVTTCRNAGKSLSKHNARKPNFFITCKSTRHMLSCHDTHAGQD